MGDRVRVEIKIRKNDFNFLVKKYHKKKGKLEFTEEAEINEIEDHDNHVLLIGDEINYAEWSQLENLLHEDRIEYDKSWDWGGGFGPGQSFYRNIKDKYKNFEISEIEAQELTVLKNIKEMLETKTVTQVKKHIEKVINKKEPFTPVPLDQPNSIRFIKEA